MISITWATPSTFMGRNDAACCTDMESLAQALGCSGVGFTADPLKKSSPVFLMVAGLSARTKATGSFLDRDYGQEFWGRDVPLFPSPASPVV